MALGSKQILIYCCDALMGNLAIKELKMFKVSTLKVMVVMALLFQSDVRGSEECSLKANRECQDLMEYNHQLVDELPGVPGEKKLRQKCCFVIRNWQCQTKGAAKECQENEEVALFLRKNKNYFYNGLQLKCKTYETHPKTLDFCKTIPIKLEKGKPLEEHVVIQQEAPVVAQVQAKPNRIDFFAANDNRTQLLENEISSGSGSYMTFLAGFFTVSLVLFFLLL